MRRFFEICIRFYLMEEILRREHSLMIVRVSAIFETTRGNAVATDGQVYSRRALLDERCFNTSLCIKNLRLQIYDHPPGLGVLKSSMLSSI